AVIGNPPYVRQEQIKELKPALKKAYQAFDGTADLYVYFYELGLRLLRPGGRLSYVVTNKWLRAGYAEELRGLLSSEGWLEAVADFGHAKKFFPGADVFPCVIVARRPDGPDPPDETEVCQIPRDVVRLDRVSQQVSELAFPLPRASFTRQAWALDPPEVAALMEKIRRAGVPLEEYAGTKPYRGVLTGYNEAFLIDTPTHDALVAADPKCEEIIKPYLRGQDIERWYAPWRGLWMIVLQSSANRVWPWSDAGDDAERLFQQTYPSLYRHLAPRRAELQTRQDKGRFWWELRACSYYEQFEETKIVYQEIQYHPSFARDHSGSFCNNKVFFIPNADASLITALNSPLIWWHNWRHLAHLKDEALSPQAYRIERLSIAAPSDAARQECIELVDQLVNVRKQASETCTLLRDWYAAELGISKPSQALLEPFWLSSDDFVEQIRKARGVRKPLSAAGVQAVREDYANTVQPMQAVLREAEGLERRLSDLVNQAYGLTPDEVRLMWKTAPPRMPLTPEAEERPQVDEAAE
ncbi:MAG: Eco57I restriction-modification methylase domain-containing protein, partial [Geminicoccaceae bacterium]